jgi:hypothetical protein
MFISLLRLDRNTLHRGKRADGGFCATSSSSFTISVRRNPGAVTLVCQTPSEPSNLADSCAQLAAGARFAVASTLWAPIGLRLDWNFIEGGVRRAQVIAAAAIGYRIDMTYTRQIVARNFALQLLHATYVGVALLSKGS